MGSAHSQPNRFSERAPLTMMYLVGAGVAATGFAAAGALLAATLPYHQWDSFAFGEWSRAIAERGTFDPMTFGPLSAARPLFYELQGLVWRTTGISFTAAALGAEAPSFSQRSSSL